MDFIKRYIFFVFAAFIVFLGGCSDVEFNPSDVPPPVDVLNGAILQESFVQRGDKGQVDILFVVDNSGSMLEEQNKLGERIRNFLGHLEDVDWQLGITTTDVSDGKYGVKGALVKFKGTNTTILTKDHPNYEQVFLDTVVREETKSCKGTCPSGDEQPLKASILAMQKRATTNSGFFRPTADLVIVYLTDEDEMSDGQKPEATKPEDVLATFKSIWGDTKKLDAYGIIIVPGDVDCYKEQYDSGGNFGNLISQLAKKTRGLVGSICHSDYASTLSQIGLNVFRLLQTFEVTKYPVEGSVQLKLIPEQNDIQWTVTGKTIEFARAPAMGTKVVVTYRSEE